MKLHKGDTVKILIGKDRGREGEIIQASPKSGRILVKGINMFKRHIKASQGQPGRIVEKERAILASKAILVCPTCKKTTRVGLQIDKEGSKYRICKKCQSLLPVNK